MHNNNGFNAILTSAGDPLTHRNAQSEVFYNIKPHHYANFNARRPVIVGRPNPMSVGVSLEYSHTGGHAWHIVSCHETVIEALAAFAALPSHKDVDPRHYRILKEY